MSPVDSITRQSIIKQIEAVLHSAEIDQLSNNDIEYITKSLIVDQLKTEIKSQIRKNNLDIDGRVMLWLNRFKSESTKKIYKRAIGYFLGWCSMQSIHPIDVKAVYVDKFLIYVREHIKSNNSQRIYISAASSFYSYLVRLGDIEHNYFLGAKYPKKDIKTKTGLDIPRENDIQAILEALENELNCTGRGAAGKQRQARILKAVSHLIFHTGLRLGALPSLRIDSIGHYTAMSKGREVKGQLSAELLSTMKDCGLSKFIPFRDLKTGTLQQAFRRFMLRTGMTVYSLHDLRHYFAVQHYKKNKDIIKLKELLGHSSVNVTEVYLSSINV